MLVRRGWSFLLLVSVIAAGRAHAQFFYVGPGKIVMYKVWSPYYGDQLYMHVIRPRAPYRPTYPYVPQPYGYRPGRVPRIPRRDYTLPTPQPRRYYSHPDARNDVDEEQAGVSDLATKEQPAAAGTTPTLMPPATAPTPEGANGLAAQSPVTEKKRVSAPADTNEAQKTDKRQLPWKAPRRKPNRYR
jgi:hypothetical protein